MIRAGRSIGQKYGKEVLKREENYKTTQAGWERRKSEKFVGEYWNKLLIGCDGEMPMGFNL